MSSPREAVYDVLQAKRGRALDAAKKEQSDDWKAYESANVRADAEYRRRSAGGQGRP